MKRVILSGDGLTVVNVERVSATDTDGLLVPDDHPVGPGMILLGPGPSFGYPQPDLEERRSQRMAELAQIRWEKSENFEYLGVVTAANSAVPNITAAVVALQVAGDPSSTITWKLGPRTFVQFNMGQLVGYGMAVRAHVQACFAREAELLDQLGAASSVAEIEAVDLGGGWPE